MGEGPSAQRAGCLRNINHTRTTTVGATVHRLKRTRQLDLPSIRRRSLGRIQTQSASEKSGEIRIEHLNRIAALIACKTIRCCRVLQPPSRAHCFLEFHFAFVGASSYVAHQCDFMHQDAQGKSVREDVRNSRPLISQRFSQFRSEIKVLPNHRRSRQSRRVEIIEVDHVEFDDRTNAVDD